MSGGGGVTDHYVIIGVAFMIVVGAAVRNFLKKFPIPYTVILVCCGIGIALLCSVTNHNFFSTGITRFGLMDAHLILFLFLPPLLFESAFDLDVEVFWRVKWQVLLLAGPGLVISTFVTGGLAYLVLPLHLIDALLIGSIISATDPVAVVALLKELGASKKLGHVIEGESMVNDGTAIVMFSVIVEIVKNHNYLSEAGFGGVLWEFVRMACVAVIFGLICGSITMFWIGRVFNDPYVEIALTLTSAYMTFFLGERWLHVSGVLAVVTLAIYCNYNHHSISPEVHHFLHQFWGMTGYLANTLIFVLVGLRVAISNNDVLGYSSQWGYMLYVYFLANFVRAIVVFVSAPVLKRTGYGFNWREGILMVWGGLRGAVALALSIVAFEVYHLKAEQLEHDHQEELAEELKEIGDQVLFYISGTVLLTLVINAPTMPKLVRFLKMNTVPADKQVELKAASILLYDEAERKVLALKKSAWFSGTVWDEARTYFPIYELPDVNRLERAKVEGALANIRNSTLKVIRNSYLSAHEEGLIGTKAMHSLLHSVGELMNSPDKDLTYEWFFLNEHTLHIPFFLKQKFFNISALAMDEEYDEEKSKGNRFVRFFSKELVQSICKHLLRNWLMHQCDVAYGFAVARNEAVEKVTELTRSQPTMGALIISELEQSRRMADQFLKERLKQYPSVVRTVQTIGATRQILYAQRKAIHRLVEEGILDDGDDNRFVPAVEEQIKRLYSKYLAVPSASSEDILREVTWMSLLEPATCEKVMGMGKRKKANEGERVECRDGNTPAIIVITAGLAEPFDERHTVEELKEQKEKKSKERHSNVNSMGPGSVLNERSILTNEFGSTIQAITPTLTYYVFNLEDLFAAMDEFHDLRDGLESVASIQIAREVLAKSEPFRSLPRTKLSLLLEDTSVVRFEGESLLFKAPKPCVLVRGHANRLDGDTNGEELHAPAVLLNYVVPAGQGPSFTLSRGSRILVLHQWAEVGVTDNIAQVQQEASQELGLGDQEMKQFGIGKTAYVDEEEPSELDPTLESKQETAKRRRNKAAKPRKTKNGIFERL